MSASPWCRWLAIVRHCPGTRTAGHRGRPDGLGRRRWAAAVHPRRHRVAVDSRGRTGGGRIDVAGILDAQQGPAEDEGGPKEGCHARCVILVYAWLSSVPKPLLSPDSCAMLGVENARVFKGLLQIPTEWLHLDRNHARRNSRESGVGNL